LHPLIYCELTLSLIDVGLPIEFKKIIKKSGLARRPTLMRGGPKWAGPARLPSLLYFMLSNLPHLMIIFNVIL